MKSHSTRLLNLPSEAPQKTGLTAIAARLRLALVAGCCLTVAIALPSAASTLTTGSESKTAIAQALPTPLPPLPASDGVAPASGEQYLVLVNGNSELLLQQVRQIEPGAFVNYVGGRSMIQAGRFNSQQNAQLRANELAGLGIGAEVQTTDYAGAPIPVTPPTDYALTFPASGQPSAQGDQFFPTGTVAAAPSAIEFGQAPPFPSGNPATGAAFPPAPTAFPNNAAPPSGNVAPPPVSSPAAMNESLPSGYYVVIPANMLQLQNIANRVVTLGAPSSLVRTRTAPRGPHLAVGPYSDRGLAQEWNDYLRNAGFPSARVHFE